MLATAAKKCLGPSSPQTLAWTYAHDVIETLGPEGMSSDESDGGSDDESFTRPRYMEWRVDDVDNMMDAVDKVSQGVSAHFTTTGPKPLTRVMARKRSRRVDPRGLPRPLYDNRWYEALSLQQKKEVGASSCFVQFPDLADLKPF